jgi:hypothetical protein
MKKTLLIAAAALVAGIVSSNAQVYSANVVGYVNVVYPAGALVLTANPLDDGTNTTTSLGAALPNKSNIQIWNGTGFTGTSKSGGVWSPDLSIPVGTGYFVQAKTAITNTYVGNVATLVGNSVTNALPTSLVLVGTMIPYTGNLEDTNLNVGPSLPNKSNIQVWNGSGFTGTSKSGGTWTPDLTLSVGQGFFIQAKTAANWVQTLP